MITGLAIIIVTLWALPRVTKGVSKMVGWSAKQVQDSVDTIRDSVRKKGE